MPRCSIFCLKHSEHSEHSEHSKHPRLPSTQDIEMASPSTSRFEVDLKVAAFCGSLDVHLEAVRGRLCGEFVDEAYGLIPDFVHKFGAKEKGKWDYHFKGKGSIQGTCLRILPAKDFLHEMEVHIITKEGKKR